MSDKIYLLDVATGEEIVREMTVEEQALRDAEIAAWELKKAEAKAEAIQLKETKIAAYKKLGLTNEEIEALLPPENVKPIVSSNA